MRAGQKPRAARLLQIFAMLAVVLVADRASAMTSVAGMCDPVGASAPAPLPVMPARGGSIDVLDDCEELFAAFGTERPHQDSASLDGPNDAPKPAMLAVFQLVKRAGARLPLKVSAIPVERPGHGSGVFRPPRR